MNSELVEIEADLDNLHDIIVLGPVAIGLADSATAVRGQQGKVMASLVAAYPDLVKVDTLIEALWTGSPPSTARTGLGVVLHRLRERLGGPDAIAHEHDGYRLTVPKSRLDFVHFDDRCARAQVAFDDGDAETARVLLSSALDLWQGDAFQPFDADEAIRLAASELEERRCGAEDVMFDVLLAAGRPDEAANWAQRLVSATPYRESRWYSLAFSLYQCQRQAEALRSITEASRVLREDIGVDIGPELRQLERDILDHAVPIASAVGEPTRVEPAFATTETVGVRESATRIGDPETTYVGRDGDIDAVATLLDVCRFVTVVGAAGSGKTRLVARLVRSIQNRVIWIDLAPLSAVDVLRDLANELGIPTNQDDRAERIRKELATQPTIVVLDNCEHLVDAAADVARLVLTSAHSSSVLTTSRVALGDASESCYVLPELSVEDGAQLLLDRAFGGSNTRVDSEQLAELVRRLDANPLLLELIAEPVRSLSVEAVGAQLERVLGQSGLMNTDHRHTSLMAAIDWSVELLDPAQQQLFATLGVMRGSFSTADVATIAGEPEAVIESQLEVLCRHGLLTTDRRTGHILYRQPEAVGIDARRRVHASGSSSELFNTHTATFVRLAHDNCARLWSPDEAQSIEQLSHARSQLGATHERLVGIGDAERAATLAIAMWDYSFLRLDIAQFDWARDVLNVDGVRELPQYPELLGTAAMAAWAQNDFFESVRFADEAIAAAGAHGVPLQALRARFNVASFREPGLGPMKAFGELISATIDRGATHLRCDLEVLLALGLLQIGDTDGARESALRGIATAEATMNPSCLAWASYGLGWTQLHTDASEASRLFLAAARQARSVGNRFVEAMGRGALATSARHRRRPAQARSLLIEAIENWDRLQSTPQLIRACREAVLLLADMGDTDGAQRALTHLELVDLGHPMVPQDQSRFDALADELGYLDDPLLLGDEASVVHEILLLLA